MFVFLFQESYRQVMKMRAKDLRKRLMVKFKGEEGLDYGGVARYDLYLCSNICEARNMLDSELKTRFYFRDILIF